LSGSVFLILSEKLTPYHFEGFPVTDRSKEMHRFGPEGIARLLGPGLAEPVAGKCCRNILQSPEKTCSWTMCTVKIA
jgi:hypothetical protein